MIFIWLLGILVYLVEGVGVLVICRQTKLFQNIVRAYEKQGYKHPVSGTCFLIIVFWFFVLFLCSVSYLPSFLVAIFKGAKK